MKVLLVVASVLALQTQAKDPLELTTPQNIAAAEAMAREPLSGVRSVELVFDALGEKTPFEINEKDVTDAIELELLRSGIQVKKKKADAVLYLNTLALPLTVGGKVSGYCARLDLSIHSYGYTEGWQHYGKLVLYENASMIVSGDQTQDDLTEAFTKKARSFCVEWMKQNPKSQSAKR